MVGHLLGPWCYRASGQPDLANWDGRGVVIVPAAVVGGAQPQPRTSQPTARRLLRWLDILRGRRLVQRHIEHSGSGRDMGWHELDRHADPQPKLGYLQAVGRVVRQ